MIIRVVKVGGSLFERSNLPAMLQRWFDDELPRANVMISGGGPWADAVRQLDRRGGVTAAAAHELAIRAMSLTGWVLSRCEPTWHYCDTFGALVSALAKATAPVTIVFDPAELIARHEPTLPGTPLGVGWHVTSDSIAARLAEILGADELVLLKSAPTAAATLYEAARSGYVDDHFPQAAQCLPRVRCVDLIGRQQRDWLRDAAPTTTTSDRRDASSDCAPRRHDA
jgi:aspartokinase-like uncharacterized kinase